MKGGAAAMAVIPPEEELPGDGRREAGARSGSEASPLPLPPAAAPLPPPPPRLLHPAPAGKGIASRVSSSRSETLPSTRATIFLAAPT